jgi:hypothetical protein
LYWGFIPVSLMEFRRIYAAGGSGISYVFAHYHPPPNQQKKELAP